MIAPLIYTERQLPVSSIVRERVRLCRRQASSERVGHSPRSALDRAPFCDNLPAMKTLLIVYPSMTGGTLQMAQAAAAGARSEPALQVSLLGAGDAGAAE